MTTDMDAYKAQLGLVETTDPDIDKPVFRDQGFASKDDILTMQEMEERMGEFVRKIREERGLTRADLAPLLGLSVQVYGRYERAFSKLHVTRMIHLCEILNFIPMEMIFDAAPHLWGATLEEATDRLALAKLVVQLPHQTTKDLLRIVEHLTEPSQKKPA